MVLPLRVSSTCNDYDAASTTARAATSANGASTSPAPSSKLSDDSGTAIGVPSRSQVERDAGRVSISLNRNWTTTVSRLPRSFNPVGAESG